MFILQTERRQYLNMRDYPKVIQAVFVKVNDNIVTNYTVSYKNKTITFTTAPNKWTKSKHYPMSGNGEMILDIDPIYR